MQNDAKLGLVAGVAGVVVAGVLYSQPPEPAPLQAPHAKTAAFDPSKPAGSTSASLPVGKPQPEVVTVSRKTDRDD
ncbi:MAG TPA: hypothetical protein VMZ71_15225 [Gemmataceae bacterium]|nr:hypothetical protein [Gemmataceae bacterium]